MRGGLKGTWSGALAGGIVAAVVMGGTALAGSGIGGVFQLGTTNAVNATTALTGHVTGAQLGVQNHGSGPAIAGAAEYPGAAVRGVNTSSLNGSVAVSGDATSGLGIGVTGRGGNAGVIGQSSTGDGVLGYALDARGVAGQNASTTSAAVLGVNSKGTGVYGNSQSSTFADGLAGVHGFGYGNAGGYFQSTNYSGLVAVGPGDKGYQGGPGNGVDAGTTAKNTSGVYAHWDGSPSSSFGYGLFASAPSPAEAGHFEGDVHITGNLKVDGLVSGLRAVRVNFNFAPSTTQYYTLGAFRWNVSCGRASDNFGDFTYLDATVTNRSTETGSINAMGIAGDGGTKDNQAGVAPGETKYLDAFDGSSGGTGREPRMRTGSFVWRLSTETITGTYDYYVDDSHCELYANLVRIGGS